MLLLVLLFTVSCSVTYIAPYEAPHGVPVGAICSDCHWQFIDYDRRNGYAD